MKYLISIFLIFFVSFGNAAYIEDFQYYKENRIVEDYKLKLYKIWNNIYNNKRGITHEDIKNIEIIEQQANHINNSDLFYNLAVIYMNISRSVKAEKWMAKAAKLYHPYAFHNIGWWYDHGFGHIEEDKAIAASFYNIAYWKLGVTRSGIRLAEIIFFDEVTEFDADYGIEILTHMISKPSTFNLEDKSKNYANLLLGRFYFQLHFSENQENYLDKAINHFKEASNENDTEANLFTGKALRTKYRITNDIKYNREAKLYYSKAASLGSGDAMIYLGTIYLENYTTDEEKVKGLGWILTGYSTGKIDTRLAKQVSSNLSKIDSRFISILRPLVVSCHEKKYQSCFINGNFKNIQK